MSFVLLNSFINLTVINGTKDNSKNHSIIDQEFTSKFTDRYKTDFFHCEEGNQLSPHWTKWACL